MGIVKQYILFAVIFIFIIGIYLFNAYTTEKKLALEKTSNTSLLISEWIKSSFNLTDYLLRDILSYVKKEDLIYPHPNPKKQKHLTNIMTEKMKTFPNAILVGIFNKECIITHGNKTEPGWDGSKRDYCIKLRDNPKLSVFVTNAYVSSTGPLNVTQSRKFLENDAGFHGFSAVGVSLEFFSTWLNQINTGRQGEVAILDAKLQLLARKPMIQDSLGKAVNDSAIQDFILSDLDEKTLTIKSPFDQINRIYSIRKVPQLPFVVMVGKAQDEWLSNWKKLFGFSFIAVLVILGLGWIVVKNYAIIVTQRKYLETEKKKNEKFTAIGQKISYVTHQWKQPLSVLAANTTNLHVQIVHTPDVPISSIKKNILFMDESIKEINKTLSSIINLFVIKKIEDENFFLVNSIEKTLQDLAQSLEKKKIELRKNIDKNYVISGSENLFLNMITNILQNSIDTFTEEIDQKFIKITCNLEDTNIVVEIEDNAGGIKLDPIESVFEPEITTKVNGMGIGLAFCKQIIEDEFSGNISVFNTENGSRFRLFVKI